MSRERMIEGFAQLGQSIWKDEVMARKFGESLSEVITKWYEGECDVTDVAAVCAEWLGAAMLVRLGPLEEGPKAPEAEALGATVGALLIDVLIYTMDKGAIERVLEGLLEAAKQRS